MAYFSASAPGQKFKERRHTGAVLRGIADHYDEWARQEDDQSEDFDDQGS